MKKLLSVGLIAFSGAAFANGGSYFQVDGGSTTLHHTKASTSVGSSSVSTKSGGFFDVKAGQAIDDNLRVEGEINYRKNRIKHASANIRGVSAMGNVYFDLHNDSPIVPYAGVGVGVARTWLRVKGNDTHYSTRFAYQAKVGASFDVTDAVALDAGYTYYATTRPKYDGVKVQYRSSNIGVGARVKF